MSLIKSLIKLVKREQPLLYTKCLDHRTWLSRQVQEVEIDETLSLQLNKQSIQTMEKESRKRAQISRDDDWSISKDDNWYTRYLTANDGS
jgi:IS5 family transposase